MSHKELVPHTPIKFPAETKVRHVKTGGTYTVVMTPDMARLESTGEPAYGYCQEEDPTAPVWFRAQSIMEDGRFESVGFND